MTEREIFDSIVQDACLVIDQLWDEYSFDYNLNGVDGEMWESLEGRLGGIQFAAGVILSSCEHRLSDKNLKNELFGYYSNLNQINVDKPAKFYPKIRS